MTMSITVNKSTGSTKIMLTMMLHQSFTSIPIGSTLAVQQEDDGPWTHGTTVGKGDCNHHNQLYTIQLTITGRRISCNRQHIKPTSITADNYIHYQATKMQTDKLIHWMLSWNTSKQSTVIFKHDCPEQ